MRKLLSLVFTVFTGAIAAQAQPSYSNAVMALNPVAYWPLNETTQPPPAYVATNIGTLGAAANGYYDCPSQTESPPYTLFTGPVPGVTSDGDYAASFPGSAASSGDPNAYIIIPHTTPSLTTSGAFTAEVWVQPQGGDPNDITGTSYASTEWTSIMKEGYGGYSYGDGADANGDGAGWAISLAGIYSLGYPVGWYEFGTAELMTNANWVVDFFSGNNGGSPSLEFDVPMYEPTPAWFHLVLVYDGTNATFYTNGVVAATTVPGLPQSTNMVWAPNQPPITSPSGAYQFTPHDGISFMPDAYNPIVLGDLTVVNNNWDKGYPNGSASTGTYGFNNQLYMGALDEVALYHTNLSAATVAKHFADATADDHTLYTNDVLSASPLVYLRLDEPAYTFPDPSTFPPANNLGNMGPSANGVYEPGTVPGLPGPSFGNISSANYATRINGLDAGVDVANVSGTQLDPTGNPPFSVAYWFRGNPSDCYARFQTILGRGDRGWRSGIDQQGRLRWNPGAGPELASPGNYNDGAWHHVVGVTDGSTDYLYVDGFLTTSSTGVATLGGTLTDLLLGGPPDYTLDVVNGNYERYFAGELAEVSFFTNALSTAQVQALYNSASIPAAIIQEPPASLFVDAGSNAVLNTIVGGTPPLTITWYQNGTPVTDSGDFSGSTTSNLMITDAKPIDGGSFVEVVSNIYGSATSSVSLVTVATAPLIPIEPGPLSESNYVGNAVSYNVGASGAEPLTYQWARNNIPIPGATGTNYSPVTSLGATVYTVTVSNSLGTAVSIPVTNTGVKFVPPATGFAVNFNVASDGAYQGMGVYQDASANTNWNVVPLPTSGTTNDVVASSGVRTLVSLYANYGFLNSGNNTNYQGSPCFIVMTEAGINGGNPGVGSSSNPEGEFQFQDVPPGVYTLYVYAANYDGNRGSIITLNADNGGQADGGTNATQNVQSDHNCDTMVEGDNYVFFHNVAPDATGAITGYFVPNPNGTLTGEGQISGLQLVMDIATIQRVSGGQITITWSGGQLESAPTVAGPWTAVVGSSPLTVSAAGTQQFFRVY